MLRPWVEDLGGLSGAPAVASWQAQPDRLVYGPQHNGRPTGIISTQRIERYRSSSAMLMLSHAGHCQGQIDF
jgi:hypothetical protein